MDEEYLKDLINDLKYEDLDVREKAIQSLAEIGEQAVEPLIKVLKDKDINVQRGAAKALGGIGDSRAVEPIIEILKDKYGPVLLEIVGDLEKLGWTPRNDAEKAYYLLVKKQWRELTRLGKPAILPLINSLNEEDDNVRLKVVEALGDIYLTQALRNEISIFK